MHEIKTLDQLEKLTDNRLMGYFKARRKILNIGQYHFEQEDDLHLEMSRIKLVMIGRGHIERK